MQGQEKEDVREVRLEFYGGKVLFSPAYWIDKQWAGFEKYAPYPRKLKSSKQKPTKDWVKVMKALDLKKFKTIKEGESVQASCGTDAVIVVITDKQQYRKQNAHDNTLWKNLYDILHNQWKEDNL